VTFYLNNIILSDLKGHYKCMFSTIKHSSLFTRESHSLSQGKRTVTTLNLVKKLCAISTNIMTIWGLQL